MPEDGLWQPLPKQFAVLMGCGAVVCLIARWQARQLSLVVLKPDSR